MLTKTHTRYPPFPEPRNSNSRQEKLPLARGCDSGLWPCDDCLGQGTPTEHPPILRHKPMCHAHVRLGTKEQNVGFVQSWAAK